MKYYKKNPLVPDGANVHKVRMNSDTIVSGDGFAPFADPDTFRGWIPLLVEVRADSLTDEERRQGKLCLEKEIANAPKPVSITTSNFIASPVLGLDIIKPKVENITVTNIPVPVSVIESVPETKVVLGEVYTQLSFMGKYPGVTTRNVEKVFSTFDTVEDLVVSSNSKLRKAGIQPNFFDRFRSKAKSELEEIKLQKDQL